MYIDTHAHTYLENFNDDLDEVIERALKAKVTKILLPNIDLATLKDVFRLQDKYPDLFFPMVGLHPCSVGENYKNVLDQMESQLAKNSIVAIGEIGVDLYWDRTLQKEQEAAFRFQINWAKENELPIVIHSREAIDVTVRIVKEEQDGNLSGVFHCFSDSLAYARKIIDLGFYLGIGGVATFKKMQDLRETIHMIGIDRIVLETDSPYLSPVPFRGKRNESSYLPYIAEVLADTLKMTAEQVAFITSENARVLFKL